MNHSFLEIHRSARFGHRRMAPRVCIIDGKPHIRTFLAEALEDLGFVARPCAAVSDLAAELADVPPDIVVLGLLVPESDVTRVLHMLASQGYGGKIMLFGGRASPVLLALHELGEQAGLAMLPPLRTPFRDSDLRENLAEFLPIPPSPSLPVDAETALRNGWLELWYQPRIDLRAMALGGAEALVRMRHPDWGVVPPASFVPGDSDPQLRTLSEFVFDRAMADWGRFSEGRAPIELMIHLPISVLEQPDFVERICLGLPDHIAFARLTVEISSLDVRRDPAQARQSARQLADCNVGISIDDVMAEASWIDIGDFPIAELQVDRSFIAGCADDRHKRTTCGMVLSIAKRIGARTVAKGIETAADFKAVSEMGFDLGVGHLFAKPMDAAKFARTMLRGRRGAG